MCWRRVTASVFSAEYSGRDRLTRPVHLVSKLNWECKVSKSRVTLRHVFATIIWPRRNILFVGLVLIVINRLSGLVLPGSSKYLMDDVVANSDVAMLKVLIVVVAAAIAVQSITSYLLTRILSVEAQRVIAGLRSRINAHVLRLPVGYFDDNPTGALVSRIMSDVDGVRNLIGTGLVQLFGGILASFICLVLLIRISPLMTLYVVFPITVFGLIMLKAYGYIRPIFRERRKITAEVSGRLTETLNGIRVIKGFSAEAQEIGVFDAGVYRLFDNVRQSLTATSLVTSLTTFLLGTATAGVMAIGGYMIISDQLTVGEFLSFTLYLGFLIAPIVQMSSIGTQLTEAFAGLDRTEELMNLATEDSDVGRDIDIDAISGAVEFRNVTFAYGDGDDVISSIAFEAPAGSVTALVGTSGSGKSTIASLAASFLTPTSGTILVDGYDLSRVTLESYRSRLGVVLQDDFLFEGSIRENILFSRPDASEEELRDAVTAARIREFSDRFADGLDTVVGERGVKLSGGQRQRISIARAILADPRILILDEATSNLDTESEVLIQESLTELMRGRTTLVIAHRLSTIRKADQILVIEHGRIAERGTHAALIEAQGRYHELYTYQARI